MYDSQTGENTIVSNNPDNCNSDDRSFVLRPLQLQAILGRLHATENTTVEHLLLCGAKGSGKSSLISQVVSNLKNDDILPVELSEHSHEVLTIADFYLELLFHLGHCQDKRFTDQPDLKNLVWQCYQQWQYSDDDKLIIEKCQGILQTITDRLSVKLLLIIENLQDLLKDTERDFCQQFEQHMLTNDQIIVLATATNPLVRLGAVHLSLVKQFAHIELPPLTTAQVETLWHHYNSEKTDTEKKTDVRPIQILSHGLPKAVVAMTGDDSGKLSRQLDNLLIAYNDYFELHLKSIAPKERKVYLALVDLWQPSTTKQITDRARLEIRAVSALLGRLVSKGLITETSTGKNGKGKIYSVSDPLLSLYYQFTRLPQQSRPYVALLKFMSTYYSHKDWSAQRKSILANAQSQLPLAKQLCHATWVDEPLAQQLTALIDINQLNTALRNSMDAYDWLTAYIGPIDDARMQQDYDALLNHAKTLAKQPVINQFVLMRCATEDFIATALAGLNQPMTAIGTYQELIDEFSGESSTLIQVMVAQAYVNMGLCFEQLQQIEAASKCYSDAISKAGLGTHEHMAFVKAKALSLKGLIYLQLDKPASAVNSLARLTNDYGEHQHKNLKIAVANSYLNQGLIWLELDQTSHGIKSLQKLCQSLKDETLDEVQQAVVKGYLVLSYAAEKLNKMDDALAHLDNLLTQWQDKKAQSKEVRQYLADAWLQRAMLLYKSDRADEAMTSLEGVFETSAHYGTPSYSALTLVTYLAADSSKIPQLLQMFTTNPLLEKTCLPMRLALQMASGESVLAPTEYLLVAEDIVENIARARAISNSDAA